MTSTKLARYDVAEDLASYSDMAMYLDASLKEAAGDADGMAIVQALGDVARAIGMSQLAKELGISRPRLFQAIADENNLDRDLIEKIASMLSPHSKNSAAQG